MKVIQVITEIRDVPGQPGCQVEVPIRFRELCHVDVPPEVAAEIASRAGTVDHFWPNCSRRIKVPWHRDHELFDENSRRVLEAETNRCVIV